MKFVLCSDTQTFQFSRHVNDFDKNLGLLFKTNKVTRRISMGRHGRAPEV